MACSAYNELMELVMMLVRGPGYYQPPCDWGHETETYDLKFFTIVRNKAEKLVQREDIQGCQEVLNRRPGDYISRLEKALDLVVDHEFNISDALHEALDECNKAAADYYGNTEAKHW